MVQRGRVIFVMDKWHDLGSFVSQPAMSSRQQRAAAKTIYVLRNVHLWLFRLPLDLGVVGIHRQWTGLGYRRRSASVVFSVPGAGDVGDSLRHQWLFHHSTPGINEYLEKLREKQYGFEAIPSRVVGLNLH